jgi:hypothetical protein
MDDHRKSAHPSALGKLDSGALILFHALVVEAYGPSFLLWDLEERTPPVHSGMRSAALRVTPFSESVAASLI